jgi:hypothetical protein
MKVSISINSISFEICVITAYMKIVIHKQHPINVTAVKAPKAQFENACSEHH